MESEILLLFWPHKDYFLLFFFKSGFEIRISCKRINEWLKQDLWLLRQSDSSLLANVLSVTKGGGNYLFSKQFFTFKYLTVKFVGNLCKWHSDPKLTISFRNYWGKLRSVLLAKSKEPSMPLPNNFHHQIYRYFLEMYNFTSEIYQYFS